MSKSPEIVAAPSSMPTMRRADVLAMCERIGLHGITERFIRSQTQEGKLAVHRIGVTNWYSEADVLLWIHGMRRVGTGGDAA